MKKIMSLFSMLRALLDSKNKRFITLYVSVTTFLSLLEMLSLGLLSIGLAIITGGQNNSLLPENSFASNQGLIFISISIALVLVKTLLFIAYQHYSNRNISAIELIVGGKLFRSYILAGWKERVKQKTSELTRMADAGVTQTVQNFLVPLLNMPSLFVGTAAISLVLFLAEPAMAIITVIYIIAVGVILYRVVAKKSAIYGQRNRDSTYKAVSTISDMLESSVEIILRHKTEDAMSFVQSKRKEATDARASMNFWGAIPKFVLEIALVVGLVIISTVAFIVGGIANLVSTIALFGFAGFRLIPSLAMLQSSLAQVHGNLPNATDIVNKIHDNQNSESLNYISGDNYKGNYDLPNSNILEVRDVSFSYPEDKVPILQNINFTLNQGESLAVVGKSGSGKSTLISIILGLLEPTSGGVYFGDVHISRDIKNWQSKIGYVPQEVAVFEGSLSQNVALSWGEVEDTKSVEVALYKSGLAEYVAELPLGKETVIGAGNRLLSGGEKQRLGIARALYIQPKILILDEATSALDVKTESEIMSILDETKSDRVTISIAHRLSTIINSDYVAYISDGKVISVGSFSQVRREIPEFDEQAKLSGL